MTRARIARAPALALAVVAAPYLLLLKSPLRLAGDEVAYLSLAAHMAGGFPAVELPIDYPRGYPALIAGLDRIGLGIPWAFVGLNLVFLAAGTAAAYVLLRRALGLDPLWSSLICLLLLLSRVVVWTAAAARSDVPFLGVAMVCLLLLVLAPELPARKAWTALGAAAVLAAGAVELRTIGVALLPPLLFAAAKRPELLRLARRHAWVTGVCAVVACVGVAVAVLLAVRGTGYASATGEGWGTDDGVAAVASHGAHELEAELTVVGELFLNVRRARVPDAFDVAYPVVGSLLLALAVAGVWTRRRNLAATEVFAASIAAVLFVWPGNDSRLWLPVLPLLLGYVVLGVRRFPSRPVVPAVALVGAAAFAAAGTVALAQSVRTGLAGSDFPSAWARTAPWTEATYEVAFRREAVVDRRRVDREVLLLLRRYEPRAKLRSAR